MRTAPRQHRQRPSRGICTIIARLNRDGADDRNLIRRSRVASRFVTVVALCALLAGAFGCRRGQELPQKNSYAAELYVERCGTCHKAYDPHSMTAAMWDIQVSMMEPVMARAGVRPLSPDEKQTILDYLERNAGRQ